MKLCRAVVVLVFATLLVGAASAQSLGDAARQNRNQKKQASQKVITNDDLSSSAPLIQASAQESEPERTADSRAEQNAARSADASGSAEGRDREAGNTSADKTEPSSKLDAAAMTKGLQEQRKQIASLEREINLLEREHQLKVANYYADAGNQLRDSRKWIEQEKKYDEDHAAKKKELEEAKQKLSDATEDARKAGIPVGSAE